MRAPVFAARQLGIVLVAGLVAAVAVPAARAADDAAFYKGKSIDLIISTGPGAGHDANGRLVARHLGNHIVGKPAIVPKNMPGAGHVRAANYLYTQAPKDGTTIGTLIPAFVMAQVLARTSAIQFDSAKLNWLGSTSWSNSTVYVWRATGVTSVEDARKTQVIMGGTGAGSYSTLYPSVMNNLLGTRFKIVSGYKSTAEINLALERGEVGGRAGNNFNSLKAENPEWLRSGKIALLVQVGFERDPEFTDVPLLTDFAKTQEERQVLRLLSADVVIGRPFLAPPDVPAERLAVLRKAFDGLMKDPAFLKEAKEMGLDINPVGGAKLQDIVTDLVNTPAAIVAKAQLAMQERDVVAK